MRSRSSIVKMIVAVQRAAYDLDTTLPTGDMDNCKNDFGSDQVRYHWRICRCGK